MTDTQRIKKVVNWLIFQEVAENEKALADLLGYKKSSFFTDNERESPSI